MTTQIKKPKAITEFHLVAVSWGKQPTPQCVLDGIDKAGKKLLGEEWAKRLDVGTVR